MKNLLLATLLLFLFSCKEENNNAVAATKNSANIVTNVESKLSSRYSKGSSLIDAIYYEMIKDDKALNVLDDEIIAIRKNSNELIKQKLLLLDKPTEYFDEVAERINMIKDSLLKKEAKDFINQSEVLFLKKKTDLDLIIINIKQNNAAINDQYQVFKIKKTLPEIEKYEEQNPLKTEELNALIATQKQLLERLKNK